MSYPGKPEEPSLQEEGSSPSVSESSAPDRQTGQREGEGRSSEEQYRLLFACNPQPMLIYDLETLAILEVNEAMVRHYGYSREEFLAMSIKDIRPPEGIPELLELIPRLTPGFAFHSARTHRKKDGTLIEVEIASHGVVFKGKRARLVLATDITERRRAEVALRESEERYRRLIRAVTDYIYTVTVEDGRAVHTEHSPLCVAVTGYTSEEFAADPFLWVNMVLEEDRELVRWHAACLLAGEDPGPLEHRIRRKDGALRWVSNVPVLHRDASGKLISYDGLISDITARKMAEEALKEEEKKYRSLYQEFQAILNTIPDTLCLISPDLKIVWGNEAAALDIGRASLDEILGQYCYLLRHERSEPCEVCPVIRCFHSGKMETEEVAAYGKIWELRAVPLYDEQGELRGAIELARNITERKQAEEERRRLEEHMRHVQKLESLGVLAGGIAHDFNNLLMSILGNAELALLELSPAAVACHNLQEIRRAAQRAADLCRQMLAYSGKGKFVVERLNLSELVKEMAHMLEVSVSKKAILRYHFPESLPRVEADPTQLRQVIMNLITNASEALEGKTGVILVSTGLVEGDQAYLEECYSPGDSLAPGPYVYLEVTDTGCGMDAATRERIFDPFFTTKFTGRGLGLAAVLGIVRGHKGAIRVSSEPGKGSTFRILLPAVPGEASPADLGAGKEGPTWQGQGTILLIDDEEAIRRLGGQMLERLGFEVITAADGREGVEAYRQHQARITCVILDLTMPQMGGEETLGELRQMRQDLPIILSSGYDAQEVAQRFASRGLAGFIQKPYTLSRLREELQRVLG